LLPQGLVSGASALWVASRNTPDLKVNSPHFVDALNAALKPSGVTFRDSVQEFARWRYFAGLRDDAQHFQRLPTSWTQHVFLPEATLQIDQVSLSTRTVDITPGPMLIGSSYLEIDRENAAQTSFLVSLRVPSNPTVKWVLQAVPGVNPGSDGEVVDLSAGPAKVSFAPNGKRALILTVLPVSEFDPNKQTDTRYPVALDLAP
jgi:hypothetical protein